MKTQLIVDCQLLQTDDKNRGMGFYFQSILNNLQQVKDQQDVDWVFILNRRSQAIEPQHKELLESFHGLIIYADFLHKGDYELFNDAAEFNRVSLDEALTPLLKKDLKSVFLIPALFSSGIYSVFPTNGTINMMIFYDIIPYLYHEHYFRDHEGVARKDYCQRFREFYRTDHFLAISQTTADDLSIYFGVDPSRITTTLGAAADRTGLKPKKPRIAQEIGDNYVLMPSGDDYRKNNNLAAKAFNLLAGESKLVITSNFSEASQRLLTDLCPQVVFSGNVSNEEFLWLVDNAKAVFFPSEYEGLGMPILEAIERNATVICSNIPVFSEISQDAFFYFNPKSITDIKETLEGVVNSKLNVEISEKKKHYSEIMDKFSWDKSAIAFNDSLSLCRPAKPKKSLAMFCPSPTSYSAIGKYVFELHAELSRFFNIDYYVEDGQTVYPNTRINILEYAANYYPAASFELSKTKDYDYILYNIGNSEFHTETILNSLRLSENAIIHDTKLTGIFDYMVNRGIMATERRQYEMLLNELFKTKNTSCLVSIVTEQKTVFCHSNFAENAISKIANPEQNKLLKAMLPVGVPNIVLKRPKVPTISFAGIISEDKGIGLVSEVSKLGDIKVNIFGFGVLGDSPLLENIGPNIEVVKNLTDKEFQDALRNSDVLVNYRLNYNGETSLSTLEAMRYGVVVIVRRVGWFDELPDGSVMKVDNELEVVQAARKLIDDPKLRHDISKSARSFLANNHSYADYARLIKEGVKQS